MYVKEKIKMKKSDKVIGMSHFMACLFIESHDLWDEVVDLVVDCYGKVERVIH